MKLSAVIVNWNTRTLLRACLRSLAAHPVRGEQEIIVVDNASADGSADMVREEFPGVTLIANAHNAGYAAANNQGLRIASGDFLLLLNPDTEMRPGSLDTLVQTLEEHPEAAAVAPRLIGPDGLVQHSVRGFPSPGAMLAEALKLPLLFPRNRALGAYRLRYLPLDRENEVDQPMASCLLVRRDALTQIGLMDEAFPIFFNDVDWCYRARAAGWKILFTPHAEILHHGGAGTSQVRRAMIRESGRSLRDFYHKHYRGHLFPPLYALCLLSIALGTWARVLACDARGILRGRRRQNRETPSMGVNCEMEGTPPSENPDVVISVINWNTRGDLEACLRSIYEHSAAPYTGVAAVVDNASSDGSADMVAEKFPQALLVRNRENRGFAAANNQVLKGSGSRYALLLNPDAQLHPGALAALVRFMDENPDVGICGPLILNPDGSLQYSARRFPTPLAGAFRNTLLGRLFPNNRYTRDYLLSDWDHRSQRDVDWVSGAAMMIRREVLDQVGVLDERFFMYSEDVDLCYRAGEAGWRVTFYPGAVVTHARAHSSDQAQTRMLSQFHRSMYYFWCKHYAPKSSWPVRIVVPLGILTRALLLLGKNRVDNLRERLRR